MKKQTSTVTGVLSLREMAAARLKWWGKALATVGGNESSAIKLCGLSNHFKRVFFNINKNGFSQEEQDEIERAKQCLDVERFAHIVLRMKHSLSDAKEEWQNDLLYGPFEPESTREHYVIRVWCEFLDEAYGDDTVALRKAIRWKWSAIPIEYLDWRREKECLFGEVEVWRAALIKFNGDERAAAESLGLSDFDYPEIVYMLGLRQFARDCKLPSVEFIVYGLCDPRSGEVRWVGQSKHGLSRPRSLVSKRAAEKCNLGCGKWLRELSSQKLHPTIQVLEECMDVDHLNEAEKRHIAEWRERIGIRLTNVTAGGSEYATTYAKKIRTVNVALKVAHGSVNKAAVILNEPRKKLKLTLGQATWAASLKAKARAARREK